MKVWYITVLIIIILAIIFFRIKKCGNPPDNEILHFRFSRGYSLGGAIEQELYIENDTVYYKKETFSYRADKDVKLLEVVDTMFLKELEKIIRDNHLALWNGFEQSNSNVMDGNNFTLRITYKNGQSISANGYMMYPQGYQKVETELDEFFKTVEDSLAKRDTPF
ncbi:MAG: hypothetical protein IJ220_05350 [Clostridia bacterium]|nr:hypothetical protein [Clostridia bacterium]